MSRWLYGVVSERLVVRVGGELGFFESLVRVEFVEEFVFGIGLYAAD